MQAHTQTKWLPTWNDASDTEADSAASASAAGRPAAHATAWENHYTVAADREWYGATWRTTLRPALATTLLALRRRAPHRGLNIAVLGCGSSRVGPEMRRGLGWPWPWARPNVSNFDLSVAAIERMRASLPPQAHVPSGRRTGLQFVAADARDLPLATASADLVLDKGTINSIIADRGYRRRERATRRPQVLLDARAVVTEARRVLRPGGIFALVSGTDKRAKLELDSRDLAWRVDERTLTVRPEGAAGSARTTRLLLYVCTALDEHEERPRSDAEAAAATADATRAPPDSGTASSNGTASVGEKGKSEL